MLKQQDAARLEDRGSLSTSAGRSRFINWPPSGSSHAAEPSSLSMLEDAGIVAGEGATAGVVDVKVGMVEIALDY